MKKIYFLLIILVTTLLLAGCGKDATTTQIPPTNKAPATTSKELTLEQAEKLVKTWAEKHKDPKASAIKVVKDPEKNIITIDEKTHYMFDVMGIDHPETIVSILVNPKTRELSSAHSGLPLDEWYQKSTNLPRQESAKKPAGQSKPSSEVTMENFKRIRNGMTYSQVVQIFGKEGKLSISTGSMDVYVWEGDGWMSGNASVTFEKGRCMAKAQSGLE